MKILYNDRLKEIKNLVKTRSKYQKIMLLFDDNISNIQLGEIYNEVKDICIFNQSNIKAIDKDELNNGYRLIIFLCEVESYLKFNFSNAEFINVFCPLDSSILPYFLSENFAALGGENYLILEKNFVDVSVLSSVFLNNFINYFINILNCNKKPIDLSFLNEEITHQNIIKLTNNIDDDVMFFDVQILNRYNLEYEKLVLLDLIIIDAFLLLIQSVKLKNYSLVDVYKSTKENYELVEKFYALFNNNLVQNLIVLNYNCLIKYCLLVKEKILTCLSIYNYTQEDFLNVYEKVKDYSKNENSIFTYLYLFNIFGV